MFDQYRYAANIFQNEFQTSMRKAANCHDLWDLLDLLFKVRGYIIQVSIFIWKDLMFPKLAANLLKQSYVKQLQKQGNTLVLLIL